MGGLQKKLDLKKKELEQQLKKQEKEYANDEEPPKKKKYGAIHAVEDYINNQYFLRYNTIANRVEIANLHADEDAYEELNIDDLYREIRRENIKYSLADLRSMMRSSFVERYNPFEQYFESLPEWDQNTNYIENLCDYLIVAEHDRERLKKQFTKWIVRCIACALDENIANKQCLVLSGNQDDGKSYFCQWLVPKGLKEYYAENIGIDKDSLIALCENFMINMDELATVGKAELNALKSVFSKLTVKVRRPYDSKTSLAPRAASFIGNTNELQFLTDHTGTVRWLCFQVLKIDWAYSKKINPNDVWAQAYYLYKNDFAYKMSRQEIIENEQANNRFKVFSPEMSLIAQNLRAATEIEKSDDKAVFYTSTDVIIFLTDKGENKIKLFPGNVGKAMTALGFKRVSRRKEGSQIPVYGYYVMELSEEFKS